MTFIDTHAHLDYDYGCSVSDLIERAKANEVGAFLTIAAEPESLNRVKEIASEHDSVWFTNGIHPHDAKSFDPDIEKIICENATHPRCVAIGEIGLDYHYDHSDRAIQKEVFRRQLEIAAKFDLPVVIHTREAEEDTLEILDSTPIQKSVEAGTRKWRGGIHSFTGTLPFSKECLNRNFTIAFNGITTFKNSEPLREIVRTVPLTSMLLETDCPFLTPVPHRGKKNEPSYLPLIAHQIAACHGVSVEEVATLTTQNARALFQI